MENYRKIAAILSKVKLEEEVSLEEDTDVSYASEEELVDETIDIESSSDEQKPKLKPTDYETLSGLTRAEKTRALYVLTGVSLVLVTWFTAANFPIHNYFQQADVSNVNSFGNASFEIVEEPTCPPPVVLTNCTTLAPCICEPPKRDCPPITLSCRPCPSVYDACSAEKCACRRDHYEEPADGGGSATEADLLKFPLVQMINKSKPNSRQRLKTINQILTLATKWFNLMSPRIANTGIHHAGQGGSVGRSCHVCRERNEWMLCVYRNHITGFAFEGQMDQTDKILKIPNEKWSYDYQLAAYQTGFHGYFSDERTENDTMPDKDNELKFSNYDQARFLHKIFSLKYEDANGNKGVCQLCNEFADDKTIKGHIQCIWQRSVKIWDMLHLDSMDL